MTYKNIREINQMGTYFLIILDQEVDFKCPQTDLISVCVLPSSKNAEHNWTFQALIPGQHTWMLNALLSELQFNVWPPLCQVFIIILQSLDVIPRF
jgi:hypothetical protein